MGGDLLSTSTRRRGRPPEDRLRRQREIFAAVGPLILASGAKHLSMQDAARAAHVSLGGLYHYFGGKRELLLAGLRPDLLAHRCQAFHAATDHLMHEDPSAYLEAFVRFSVDGIVFIRPSVWAAVELGSDALWPSLEAALGANTREFLEALRAALTTSELRIAGIARCGRTWRRLVFGMVMDREAPVQEMEAGLLALLRGLAPDGRSRQLGYAGASQSASGRDRPRAPRAWPTRAREPVTHTTPVGPAAVRAAARAVATSRQTATGRSRRGA
jgi:AcrR family transcriptional regulator